MSKAAKTGGWPLTALSVDLPPRHFPAVLAATLTVKRLRRAGPIGDANAATIGALLMAVEAILPYSLFTRWLTFELEMKRQDAERFRRNAQAHIAQFALEGGFHYVDGDPESYRG